MTISFSIIIPSYSSANCLLECLNSIQRQTYTSYEILIIDDGSIDNIFQLLNQQNEIDFSSIKHNQESINFRVINIAKNRGVTFAINQGIEAASGTYISFLQGKDEWRSDYLENMAQALENNPESVLACSYVKSTPKTISKIEEITTFSQQQNLVSAMLLDNSLQSLSCVAIPAHIFNTVGLFDESLSSSGIQEFYLRALAIGKPTIIPQALVRKHSYSIVSIIVTCFNRSRYLAKTIESILSQTYQHFELLIWDDGSTDDSLKIARHYENKDHRIRVVEHIHQGAAPSLASAIASSTGEYIGIVDSDDLLHHEALAATVRFLDRRSDVGMVYTDRLIIDESDKLLGQDRRSSIPYSEANLLLNFMTFHFRLIRRSIYEESGGIDISLTAAIDYDLCLKISEITLIEYLDQPFYFYRQHPDSISRKKEFEQIECSQKAIANALLRRKLAPSIEIKSRLKPKFSLVKLKNPTEPNLIQEQTELSYLSPSPDATQARLVLAEETSAHFLAQDTQLISLVITVYNRQKYLASTINSILSQTYTNFELVVWDDGSTDDSLAIVNDFAKNDPRIKVFAGHHQGQGTSLVQAIAQTKGKYIGTVDSDDLLHPQALDKTLAILQADPDVGMVYTDHLVIDEQGKEKGIGKRCAIPYSKKRLLVDFMTFHFRLLRRDIYNAVGGFDSSLSSAEDYDLCLRLSEVTKIKHLQELLYYYRWHQDNLSQTQQITQVKCSAIAINRAIKRRGLEDEYKLKVRLNPRYQLKRRQKVANKVFGIGLSKTGTTSLNSALKLLGIPSIHLPHSLKQVEAFDGATDTPIALAYKELDLIYPGSKFILTIREPSSWLRSSRLHRQRILKMSNGRVSQWIKDLNTECYGQWSYDPAVWLSTYDRHLNSVVEYFRGRESDLLILNICSGQGWSELCSFLNCEVPNLAFPKDNSSQNQRLPTRSNIQKLCTEDDLNGVALLN
ncbi:MAG: glycosyltransferase [Cyanobacteria bacterium P01_A01_bin.40]